MTRRIESLSLTTEVKMEDVMAALSAFPEPPNHIPASSSSSVSISRERDAPPNSFARSKGGIARRDSELSAGSAHSTHSGASGKLSLRVNGCGIESARECNGQAKRDSASGSGSSTSSSLAVRGSSSSTPSAGPTSISARTGVGVGTRSQSPSTLNTPSSAYPASTSSSSAYSASSPSSAYPHSPAYTSRHVYPIPSTSTRTTLSMLSTTSASTSSSPSSVHVSISTVGMSSIEERDERERHREKPTQSTRRQSSVPPSSSRRYTRPGRSKTESESGREIGGPPSVPLPPIPPTPKVGVTTTSNNTACHGGPPSVKSLPSLRSSRKSVSSQSHNHDDDHTRRESGASVTSTGSHMSAFSAILPTLAGFGVAMRSRVEGGADTEGDSKMSLDDRPRSRAKAFRTVAAPLRINIPPTAGQETGRHGSQTIDKPLGSGSSLASPLPSELDGSRALREGPTTTDVGDKVQSPTASLFSVASGTTTRSGTLSAAQCLRSRVSGILEGLGDIPRVSPPATTLFGTNSNANTNGGVAGNGEGEEERIRRLQTAAAVTSSRLHPLTGSATNMSRRTSSSASDTNRMLATGNLATDLALARAASPMSSEENGFIASSLELSESSMGRALRAMCDDATSALIKPSSAHVPPLSDTETDKNEGSGEPRLSSESLLGQFPSTPIATRPPPSSFPFPTSESHTSPGRTSAPTSTSRANNMYRTMSQSRKKPLPPSPRGLRESLSSINSCSRECAAIADDAVDAIRGRSHGGRTAGRDGASSPDITSILNKTPRPMLRSKSLSARSSRSSKSLSTRSGSIKSSTRDRIRPSLPDESERQKALGRFSAISSSSSARDSRMSIVKYGGLSAHRSAGPELVDACGDIEEEDADASVDYGVAIARHRGGYDLSPTNISGCGALRDSREAGEFYADEAEAMLNDVTTSTALGEEEESDSDIDLHTPLPHIFLREGILSPQSKVLASPSSGSLTARNSLVGTGRDSVASYITNASFGSVMTKSGLYKDERDTEKRRRRHRDGKLLRGGLGLTTGLGWSDSEDEDAPSPFTNRVSSIALSQNASMASLGSQPSKKSQFFTRSTPSSEVSSGAISMRRNLLLSQPSRNAMRESEPHPLSKTYTSVNLDRGYAQRQGKQRYLKTSGDERRSLSPTSSSATSLPFPLTPRDDLLDSSEENLQSDSSRTASRTSSGGARTPTAGSLKPKQSTSSLRAPSVKSVRSAPPSRLPSTGPSTPRPLRLPALQQQKSLSTELQQNNSRLQPGQPEPGSGAILGYNRNLHDRQRTQLLATPKSAPAHGYGSPPSVVSPTLSQKSAPSGLAVYGSQRMYGSTPATPTLHAPNINGNSTRRREASPTRLSAPMSRLGKPRTGTGMVYRQSTMPTAPVGTAI